MSCFTLKNGSIFVESVALSSLAHTYGTPLYVYSKKALLQGFHSIATAFATLNPLVCYAVKANGNLTILHHLAKAGAGFDVVSLGELKRVLKAGGNPQHCVFSGVGKSEAELREAILLNIHCIDVESTAEVERIASLATELKTRVNIAIRVNPNIDANTHAHISTGLDSNKFGVASAEVLTLAKHIHTHPFLQLRGLAAHIGSQITDLTPLFASLDHLLELTDTLSANGITLDQINIGGGLGIRYENETPPSIEAYAEGVKKRLAHRNLKLLMEPGRFIVAQAGCLLTRVEYLKMTPEKNFALVDAGMNDLLRPALYDAYHRIQPVAPSSAPTHLYDIAGPVCESADFLGKNRSLAIAPGDVLAIDCAGAYGFSMSSNYNARCRPAEVLVDGDSVQVIRRRETFDDLIAMEAPHGFSLNP